MFCGCGVVDDTRLLQRLFKTGFTSKSSHCHSRLLEVQSEDMNKKNKALQKYCGALMPVLEKMI